MPRVTQEKRRVQFSLTTQVPATVYDPPSQFRATLEQPRALPQP